MRKLSITTFLLAAFSFALLPTIASATSTPPFAYSPPTISGIAQSGQTLQVASDGLWTESALSYGYNWRDCDAALTACTDIAGATNTNSVVLSDADIGSVVIVVVTDYGISGPGTAHSAPTAVVIAASPTPTPGPKPPGAGIPANTSLPTISGKAKSKSQLTAKTGRWINGPTSYKYQWKSCTDRKSTRLNS